jgi:hypothetical protein
MEHRYGRRSSSDSVSGGPRLPRGTVRTARTPRSSDVQNLHGLGFRGPSNHTHIPPPRTSTPWGVQHQRNLTSRAVARAATGCAAGSFDPLHNPPPPITPRSRSASAARPGRVTSSARTPPFSAPFGLVDLEALIRVAEISGGGAMPTRSARFPATITPRAASARNMSSQRSPSSARIKPADGLGSSTSLWTGAAKHTLRTTGDPLTQQLHDTRAVLSLSRPRRIDEWLPCTARPRTTAAGIKVRTFRAMTEMHLYLV